MNPHSKRKRSSSAPYRAGIPSRILAALLSAAAAIPAISPANEVTWTGGAGGSWDWSQGANWAGGVAPEINNNSIIHFAGNGTPTGGNTWNNLGWWNSFHQIIFDAGAASFNLQGDTPFISPNGSTPGAIINNSSNTQSINFWAMALRAGTVINAASGDLTFGSTLNPVWLDPSSFGSAITVTGGSGRAIVFNGVIANGSGNSGVIIKEGEATLKLAGSNTYSGGLLATAGVVEVQNNNGLGTGTTRVDSGAWVSLQSTTVVTNSINATGGTLGWHFTSGSGAYAGAINLTANSTVSLANYYGFGGVSGTINGTISGSGSLTVTNKDRGGTSQSGGVLTLAASNSFTGDTVLIGSTTRLTSAGALGSTSAIRIDPSATLEIRAAGSVNDSAGITLAGGRILRGAAVSETFGALTLSANSTIDFGSSAAGALNFGAYTGGGKKLTVSNFLQGNVLTFSTDLSSSINTPSLFSFDNAFASSWNGSTFTITAVPEPSTVIAGLIFLGFAACRERKRLKSLLTHRKTA